MISHWKELIGHLAKKFWLALPSALLAFFAPLFLVLGATIVITLFDLLFGVWAAKKRGEKITFLAMRRTVAKIAVYEVAIVLAYIVEVAMLGGLLPLSRMAAVAIGTVELKSTLENLNTIAGQDFLRAVIDKINGGPPWSGPPPGPPPKP